MRRNGVRNVNLPTNGLLPEKIFPCMDRMLELCPETSIDLNFSLDGMQKTHDKIRGVPNNFVRTLATMRRGRKAVSRGDAPAAQRADRDHARELRRDRAARRFTCASTPAIDGHYFEVVRGAAPDPSLKAITRESVAELHRRAHAVSPPLREEAFRALAARRPAVGRALLPRAICASITISTSSAWNRRRRGRCPARPAKRRS